MSQLWQAEEKQETKGRGNGWFWLTLIVMVAIAAVAVHRSALFRLQNAQVTGLHRLTEERVLEAAGLTRGSPRWQHSAEAVRKRLLRDPWIEDARVAWGLGTISIELTERQPVALLRYTDRFYLLLDESGTILEQTELDAYKGLPVITGRDFMQPLRGFRSDNEGLLDAVSLSARMAPALRSQISEIHADPDRTLTLYMVPGATVRWGLLPDGENRAELVADKVNWFGGIWQELNKRSGTCHIDLRVDGKEAVSGCQ